MPCKQRAERERNFPEYDRKKYEEIYETTIAFYNKTKEICKNNIKHIKKD